jgi:dTDP-4-dehydrorhamnose reductase
MVLGGGGQVASAVLAAAPPQHQVSVRSRAELDIGDAQGVARALKETGAEWVVNGAAYTAVDLAQISPRVRWRSTILRWPPWLRPRAGLPAAALVDGLRVRR